MRNYTLATILAIIVILILAVLAVITFNITLPGETEVIDETGQPITITGVVFENVIEAPADGNNFLMVDVPEGRRIVLYEEGGLFPAEAQDEQCNNNPDVAQAALNINAGDTVDVSGVIRADGHIDVCSSPDHTITVLETADIVPLPGTSADSDTVSGENDMQETRQVSGEVVELISDCAFDGNCAYVIETDNGERVTVIWAEGMSPICQNDPFNGGDTDIDVGNMIDAFGRVIDENTISGCGDPSYFISKTG